MNTGIASHVTDESQGDTQNGTTAAALQLENVSAGYGKVTVLEDVSLSVARGDVVALLGPNGAGKSTLLRTVMGLVAATRGSVLLRGNPINRMKPHQRARAGVCFLREGRGVFPRLSVRENLQLQGPRGSEGESVERAVETFPVLGQRLTQRAGTLSGGEQQMLALGRCFSLKPAVVLLDEVSMGLAPLIVDQIFEALLELRKGDISILLVEQYAGRALAMSDRTYLLNRGQLVFDGPSVELSEAEIARRYME